MISHNFLFNNFLPPSPLLLYSRGTFRMEREDGFAFDCRIPPFSLESKQDEQGEPPILGQ